MNPISMSPTEFSDRILRFQATLQAAQLDGVFLYTSVNRYYFTGLETSNGLLIIPATGAPTFYTDFRYIEAANRTLTGIKAKLFPKTRASQARDYQRIAKTWKTVGYEQTLDVARFLPLQALFGDKLRPADAAITKVRSIKSAFELDVMRRAAKANDDYFAMLMTKIKPGMSELEMVKVFNVALAKKGLTQSFDPIFCAGVNAVECHHQPDASILKPNSELLIDMGVTVDRYCSDMTRTPFFGKPTKRFREIHSIVLEANQTAMAAIKPGVPCCKIDKIARDIITKAGYGEAFGHSLGHSVGLEIHEQPGFSPKCKTVIEPGMVITVEPGIYLPGDVGVRIEDLVCITETGFEVLSHTPHELVY